MLALLSAVVPMAVAAPPMLSGRDAVASARDALADGDVARGRAELDRAARRFRIARVVLRNPLARLGGVVPVLGHTPRAAAELALAGELTARGGLRVAGAVEALPDGPRSLAPTGGRMPVEPIRSLQPALSQAADELARAQAALDAAPSMLLLGPVDDALEQLRVELAAVAPAVAAGAAIAEVLPGFLGADEPRRYFFGASQISELRGAGGFIGAYSILEVRDGRLSFGPFGTIHDLPDPPAGTVTPPSPEVAERYRRYGGVDDWVNVSISSDFPTAGALIAQLHAASGEDLDGVVVADPFALAALLDVAGPTAVPGYGTLDADAVVSFVANEAFARFDGQDERQRVLGAVAAAALQGFLRDAGGADASLHAASALSEAVRGRHLALYAVRDGEQDAFERAGVAGALSPAAGDLLDLSVNSSSNAKVDYYLQTSVEHTVRLRPDGGARGRARVGFTNTAPADGQPRYVIGPNRPGFQAGENRFFATIACASGCEVDAFSHDGRADRDAVLDRHGPHRLVTAPVRLASGASGTIEATWDTPGGVWEGDEGRLTYRLTLRTPPSFLPTAVTVSVGIPEGMDVEHAPGMAVRDGEVVFEGPVRGVRELAVTFARPDADRAWNAVTDFLSRPLTGTGESPTPEQGDS